MPTQKAGNRYLVRELVMNANDVQQLFDRLGRFAEKIKVKKGDGYQWDYTFPDGVETTYILRNIRNLNDIEDEITSYFIWVWNLKDYLKGLSKFIGRDPKEIESFVNSDNSLTICADIANRLKHGDLNKSRSSLFPTLGKLNLSLTKEHLCMIMTEKKLVMVSSS